MPTTPTAPLGSRLGENSVSSLPGNAPSALKVPVNSWPSDDADLPTAAIGPGWSTTRSCPMPITETFSVLFASVRLVREAVTRSTVSVIGLPSRTMDSCTGPAGWARTALANWLNVVILVPSTASTLSPCLTPAFWAGLDGAFLAQVAVSVAGTQEAGADSTGVLSLTTPPIMTAAYTSTIAMMKCIVEPATSTTARRPAGCL